LEKLRKPALYFSKALTSEETIKITAILKNQSVADKTAP